MASPTPPPDDTEGLLASLDDLGSRIELARSTPATPAGGGRRGRLLGLALLVVLLLGGALALRGGDGNGGRDVAAGDRAAQVTTATTLAPTSTAPPTTAAQPTTTAPTTEAAPTTTTTAPAPEPAPAPDVPAPLPSQSDGTETTWTVVPGESFWTIAEDVTAERLGHEGAVAEVTAVWSDLLAANADRLVEPGNPDLLLPGQVLVLPTTAASP